MRAKVNPLSLYYHKAVAKGKERGGAYPTASLALHNLWVEHKERQPGAMAEPTRQALEQALIKALGRENILIERQADKTYTATWLGTRGQDSATSSSLARVIEAAIRGQKANEYWRGQRELEQEIIKELRTVYPLAITITRSKTGGWRWEWWNGFGLGPDFARVLKYALDYALRTLHISLPESIPHARSSTVEPIHPLDEPEEISTEEDYASG